MAAEGRNPTTFSMAQFSSRCRAGFTVEGTEGDLTQRRGKCKDASRNRKTDFTEANEGNEGKAGFCTSKLSEQRGWLQRLKMLQGLLAEEAI
jgi:hypothetical protein